MWCLQRGYRVRALSRSADKAAALLGERAGLELVFGDLKQPGGLGPLVAGVDAVACCTGTTAFPSKRCPAAHLLGPRAGVLGGCCAWGQVLRFLTNLHGNMHGAWLHGIAL